MMDEFVRRHVDEVLAYLGVHKLAYGVGKHLSKVPEGSGRRGQNEPIEGAGGRLPIKDTAKGPREFLLGMTSRIGPGIHRVMSAALTVLVAPLSVGDDVPRPIARAFPVQDFFQTFAGLTGFKDSRRASVGDQHPGADLARHRRAPLLGCPRLVRLGCAFSASHLADVVLETTVQGVKRVA